MHETSIVGLPRRLGLTVEEQVVVATATKSLPSGWHVTFETTESHDIYARIIPPWDVALSAFLIDREAHGLVVTDNVSNSMRPMIKMTRNVQGAVNHVTAVVSGGNIGEGRDCW